MAVPKQKTSKSRRDKRRSHLALRLTQAIESCSNCSAPKLRHQVCMKCGHYRGHNVLGRTVAS